MNNDPQAIIDKGRMSTLQIVAVTLCVMLNALDGFDVLSISFASPGIAEQWGVERAALGVVLSMELIGMAFGSIVLGGVADRYGRRPTILICLLIMTAGMFAAAQAQGVVELSVYRFVTGLGIGGMLAAINAMTAEYANDRVRHMCVIIMAAGYPLGVVVGGSIAAELLYAFDWRSVFYFGTVLTVVFIPLVWWLLPESIAFLVQSRPADALSRVNTILARMNHPQVGALPNEKPAKTSVAELFSDSLRSKTILLTIAYFAHIMSFYFILKWVPKLVVDMGYHPSEAGGVLVWANVGGLLGSMMLGLLSQRVSVRILVIVVLIGAAIMVSVFGQGQDDLTGLAIVAGSAGFFTNGAIVGLYALFAAVFPTNVRAGGTGFVIGVGRGGAALGPIIAGVMFSIGYGLAPVALIMSIGSALAAIALMYLRTD